MTDAPFEVFSDKELAELVSAKPASKKSGEIQPWERHILAWGSELSRRIAELEQDRRARITTQQRLYVELGELSRRVAELEAQVRK